MRRVYIVNAARSYMGVENGIYRHVPVEELGAGVIDSFAADEQEETRRIPLSDVDLLITGNGVAAGGNVARLIALSSNLSKTTPAFTVDCQCGSGLESIGIAAAKISLGQAEVIIAGGAESCSTAPRRAYSKNHPDFARYQGEDGLGWYGVAKFAPGEHREKTMLEGAEKTAVTNGIDRQDLNAHVLRSHSLAKTAREEGYLKGHLVTIKEDGDFDEGIRDRMSEKLLNRLPGLLAPDGILTAANTCLTNDGAAYVMLASEDYVAKHHLQPMAEFIDICEVGADPSMSPVSAIKAVEYMLKKQHLRVEDIAAFECNEAFAVIDELFLRRFGEEAYKRYNQLGGALAYGHPYGASGGIITLHGIKALEQNQGQYGYGLFSVAAAGGVGSAILVKK